MAVGAGPKMPGPGDSNPRIGRAGRDARVVKEAGINLRSSSRSLGRPVAFLMAAALSGAQAGVALPLPLHASISGSKSHARGSEIMPSATPSFASHRFMQRRP